MPFNPTSYYLDNYFSEESHFCQLYPLPIQQLDKKHWSPLVVVNRATKFLVNKPDAKILDIGSGAGKFCLAGAYYKPSAFFYGVEQRQYLVDCAISVKAKLGRLHVDFFHKNFTQLDFKEFDNFYFYNSFFENIAGSDTIDDSIDYSIELYNYYTRVLSRKLDELPSGTRIVTYKSFDYEIPPGFSLMDAQMDNQLKFWRKT
jgi:SAM-dependent methyltransferase